MGLLNLWDREQERAYPGEMALAIALAELAGEAVRNAKLLRRLRHLSEADAGLAASGRRDGDTVTAGEQQGRLRASQRRRAGLPPTKARGRARLSTRQPASAAGSRRASRSARVHGEETATTIDQAEMRTRIEETRIRLKVKASTR